MWKKIIMGILVILSAVAGFAVAKVESTMQHTLNQVKRDKNSALDKVDLSGIKIESDDDIVNILLIGNACRKEEIKYVCANIVKLKNGKRMQADDVCQLYI